MFNFNHKQEAAPRDAERGQIIVILAGAMVGLLVAVGLATDAGVLFMRQAQLDRAVDAAALSGVTQLTTSTNAEEALRAANTRGQQLLAINDIFVENDPITSLAECPISDPSDPAFDQAVYDSFWDVHEYCGKRSAGTTIGAMRYHIDVRWQSETYFMKLMGFETVPLRSEATAEYMPLVDMFASDSEFNVLQATNEAIFGPGSCTHMGDAYTPVTSTWYDELEGVYTYRVRVPETYLAPTSEGGSGHDSVRIEIFDPDTRNTDDNSHTIYNRDGTTTDKSCGSDQRNPCLLTYDLDDESATREFWFVRIDENRYKVNSTTCGTRGSYTSSDNTSTLYRLYYLKQAADGGLHEVDLAYYIGKTDYNGQLLLSSATYSMAQAVAEAQATDMHWVSPGAPSGERMPAFTYYNIFGTGSTTNVLSTAEPVTHLENCETFRGANPGIAGEACSGDGNFIVDLTSETPDIYVDPGSGIRDIYLQVIGLQGASENGFEFWAGPPRSDDTALYSVPSDVNARHVYLMRQRLDEGNDEIYSPHGVSVFGLGHLPMNSNYNTRSDIPLAYLSSDFSGQQITVQLFDPDAGADDPVSFYFDTIPMSDWTACFDDSSGSTCDEVGGKVEHWVGPSHVMSEGNNQWWTYSFTIPSESSGDPDSQPFYGGRMYVSYVGGQDDTIGWKMTIDSRPFLVE